MVKEHICSCYIEAHKVWSTHIKPLDLLTSYMAIVESLEFSYNGLNDVNSCV